MTVLIAYATIEGQTGKVAYFVEAQAREAGHKTALLDLSGLTGQVDFEGIAKIVLAASVHERRHPAAFETFVRDNKDKLAERPVLLLSVSLSAAFEEYHEEAQDYVDEMKLRTGLTPDAELLVAGAIRPESYDDYAARVLRQVVLKGRSSVPTTTTHEFTDWDAISQSVSRFLRKRAAVR